MVSSARRILVVDDEEIVRESCRRALTEAGYVVRTVASGREALQACRTESFDVMLTDLRMPDMDGLEVIRAVVQESPELRVIVITGYPSRKSAEQAAQLGVVDYLEKPLSPDRLSEATAAALSQPPVRRPLIPAVPPSPIPALDQGRSTVRPAARAPASALCAQPKEPAEREAAEPAAPASRASEETNAELTRTRPLNRLLLIAAAPLIGLAYVLSLPLIGAATVLAVVCVAIARMLEETPKHA